jgi:hypothetical protein
MMRGVFLNVTFEMVKTSGNPTLSTRPTLPLIAGLHEHSFATDQMAETARIF